MKFSISQTELATGLGIVQKGVSARSTLAILSGVLLIAEGDTLTLKTTNGGDMSVTYTATALIEEPGRVVVSAKLLFDIVKNLNDAAVHFTLSGETALIKCDTSRFAIKTINAEDFPEIPQASAQNSITLPFIDFCTMVRRVSRAISKDQDRVILTGALVTIEDGKLVMVSTDSYRLVRTSHKLKNNPDAQFSAVISGTFLQDVASLPKEAADITLTVAENQVIVSYGKSVLINKRINGNFPNYKQLIPANANYTTQVVLPVSNFTAAVRRMTLLGEKNTQMKLTLSPQNQLTTISAQATDVGTVEDTLNCVGEGQDMQIAFNCAYVLDGLSVIETETCTLNVTVSNRPGIICAGQGQDYLYLVMPVKLS